MPFWVERTEKENRARPVAVIFGVPLAFLAVLALSIPLYVAADATGLGPIKAIFGLILASQLVFLGFPKLLLAANLFAIALCLIAARQGWVGWGACLTIGAFGAIAFNLGVPAYLALASETASDLPPINIERTAGTLGMLGAYGALIGLIYWVLLRWLQPRAFINRVQGRYA